MRIIILLAIFLLIGSFPVRNIFNKKLLSDIFRMIGFVLVIIIAGMKMYQNKN